VFWLPIGGIPLKTPAELNVIPGGNPDVAAHVKGGVPPGIDPDATIPGVVTPVIVTGP
jgi:hypothetical protein